MTDSIKRAMERVTAGPTEPPAPAAGGPPTDFMAFLQPMAPIGGVRKVPLSLIDPWRDEEHETQPFRLYNEDKLGELADNIKQNGVITPVRLRISPYDSTRYQTLAGHNRIAAARLAGLTEIDAIVEGVDDDQARLILVDSNLYQREKLLPSEKAFAYRMKLETLKRRPGRRKNNTVQVAPYLQEQQADLTSVQLAPKLTTEQIGDEIGISKDMVKRYIRLTYLLPELLALVDEEAIPFTAGVSLSFLEVDTQRLLLEVLRREGIRTVSRDQAEELKTLRGELTEEDILRIFGRGPATPKPQSLRFDVDLPPELLRRYRRDAELQELVAQTIQRYIEGKESCVQ